MATKRSHSPVKAHATETPPESLATPKVISELRQRIAMLQKGVEIRDVALQKVQDDSNRKQGGLDITIEDVLNWVPRAIIDARRNHEYTYRLLRQLSSQLLIFQRQLKISTPTKDFNASNVSAILRQELLDTKTTYEQDIANLRERVASLEGTLASSEDSASSHSLTRSHEGDEERGCDPSADNLADISGIDGNQAIVLDLGVTSKMVY
ncbi:hypothetical protein C8R42DRAFT_640702 [Lentinula raphanica]|nr:hypothetical protein C8R42DRAFT_640702 [Lentinula raphanica]